MYQKLKLYKHYTRHSYAGNPLPDTTSKLTQSRINIAINLCDSWDNFIDIGAGNGYNAIALSRVFKKGTIVEVEKNKEHEKIKNSYKNITIFDDFIEKYNGTGEKFDFVLLADIFEHIHDVENFMKKISQLQTKNGVIYIMTPNPFFCGPATESDIYFTRHPNGHVKHYTHQEIISILDKYGYAMIFHFYEEGPLRRKIKNVLKAIDRRDHRWKDSYPYKAVRPFALPCLRLFYKLSEKIVYHNEMCIANDPFITMTQDLAFKKIS